MSCQDGHAFLKFHIPAVCPQPVIGDACCNRKTIHEKGAIFAVAGFFIGCILINL